MSDMTFVMQRGDEPAELYPLGKYGGKASFTWGEPGARRSGIWTAVANPNGEVYILERTLGSMLKVSLHKSGAWQLAWIESNIPRNPLVSQAVASKGNRFVDRWTRPPEPNHSAPQPAYTIFTTGLDLTPAKDDESVIDKVMWLPPPTPEEIAFFNVSFVRPTGTPFTLKGMLPIFAAPLRTGEALLVTATRREISTQESTDLTSRRQAIAERVAAANALNESQITGDMRILLHSANDDGGRFALDLAATPSS